MRINFDLDETVIYRARIVAAAEGLSLTKLVEKLLRQIGNTPEVDNLVSTCDIDIRHQVATK